MNYEQLEKEHGIQKAERLAFIDFKLRFTGLVKRSDITEQFGIADAAASKEISAYKDLKSNNVDYDRVFRANLIQINNYSPLLNISAETALGMLANGFNKNMMSQNSLVPYERVGMMRNKLDIELVSSATRALCLKHALDCKYLSASSSNHDKRKIFPTALFYNGQSWMFRAFNQTDEKFKCFNFSRLQWAETSFSIKANKNQLFESDSEWQLTIPLELEIHPNQDSHRKEAIKFEFGLSEMDNILVVTEKAPLIYFLMKSWRVDVSEKPSETQVFNFYLKNRNSLALFESTKRVINH